MSRKHDSSDFAFMPKALRGVAEELVRALTEVFDRKDIQGFNGGHLLYTPEENKAGLVL